MSTTTTISQDSIHANLAQTILSSPRPFPHCHSHSQPQSPKSHSPSLSLDSPPVFRTHRASSYASSITSHETTPQRKLARKLPPRLTESLKGVGVPPARPDDSPTVSTPLPSMFLSPPCSSTPPSSYTPPNAFKLAVDPPSAHFGATFPMQQDASTINPYLTFTPSRKRSNPWSAASAPTLSTARRITSALSLRTSSQSTASTASSGQTLLTPTASLHSHFRPSIDSANFPIACSSDSTSLCGTMSAAEEVERAEREDRKRHGRETTREKKARLKAEQEAFDVDTPPTTRESYDASLLEVIAEDGRKVRFGDLVRRRRTIVIFIRHWFCPLCAQYMNSIVNEVTPEALETAEVDLVIIGNGSDKMLPAYRSKALKCPFQMYTDPTLGVYRALGLTRQTGDAGPDAEAGDYLVQSALEATVATIKRATVMPLRNPGHFLQLGGEFVFDGTLNVVYTHRMTTTRSHAPIRDVCAEAGVRLEWLHYEPRPPPPPVHRNSVCFDQLMAAGSGGASDEGEEYDWRAARDWEKGRIRRMKQIRRQGGYWSEQEQHNNNNNQIRVVGQDEDELADRFGSLGLA